MTCVNLPEPHISLHDVQRYDMTPNAADAMNGTTLQNPAHMLPAQPGQLLAGAV